MLVIPQAKPQTKYFKVFVPGRTEVHPRDKVECKDPHSGAKVTGVCMSIISIEWNRVPQWICFEAYGCSAEECQQKLGNKNSAFFEQKEIKILIIKEN